MKKNQKSNVFIFHGSYGFPRENWFPWLKTELQGLGHDVYVPKFPTPEGQKLKNWLKVFDEYLDKLNSKSIFIGHSCGSIFALRLLERLNTKIKSAFLIAGPIKPLQNEFDKVHMDFVDHPIDWLKVKNNAEHFYPIYSDNDPYVGIEHGKETAQKLGVDLIIIKNSGHFNTKAGYDKFPQLLELVKKDLE